VTAFPFPFFSHPFSLLLSRATTFFSRVLFFSPFSSPCRVQNPLTLPPFHLRFLPSFLYFPPPSQPCPSPLFVCGAVNPPTPKGETPPPRLSGGDSTHHHRSLSAHFLHSQHYPPGWAGPSLHSLGALIPHSPFMCCLALKIGNIHPFLFRPCGPCAG
jgi:hypothetical protein